MPFHARNAPVPPLLNRWLTPLAKPSVVGSISSAPRRSCTRLQGFLHGSEDGTVGYVVAVRGEFARSSAAYR
uniref:Uncharacterized protein n=1 Tax=Haematococcus lacustris TaxID=44745 RepID=A0A699ZYE2_HAELA